MAQSNHRDDTWYSCLLKHVYLLVPRELVEFDQPLQVLGKLFKVLLPDVEWEKSQICKTKKERNSHLILQNHTAILLPTWEPRVKCMASTHLRC